MRRSAGRFSAGSLSRPSARSASLAAGPCSSAPIRWRRSGPLARPLTCPCAELRIRLTRRPFIPNVRHRRICGREAVPRSSDRGPREARVPRIRLRRRLAARSSGKIETVRAVGNLANLRAAVEAAAGNGSASRSPRPRRRSGSRTPAGRPTAGSPRRTRIRTATAPTRSTSSSTASSRTTPNCAVSCRPTGHVFSSETDAEIVAHLIEKHYDGDLVDAVRAAFADLRGHYAFVAMHADHPRAARRRPPGVPADRRPRRG